MESTKTDKKLFAKNLEKVREQFLISSRTIFCVSYRMVYIPFSDCIVTSIRRLLLIRLRAIRWMSEAVMLCTIAL